MEVSGHIVSNPIHEVRVHGSKWSHCKQHYS